MANKPNTPQDLKITITPDVAVGTYSNLAIISHSGTEMILDFAQMLPGINETYVRQRILMDPVHAKRLLGALNDNIQKYERSFGPIKEPYVQNTDTVPYDILGKD